MPSCPAALKTTPAVLSSSMGVELYIGAFGHVVVAAVDFEESDGAGAAGGVYRRG